MTDQNLLIEMLNRVGSRKGDIALINEMELNTWPNPAVELMKSQKLLSKSRPAKSARCSMCIEQCTMPVYIDTEYGEPEAFIICDTRSDINRVDIPLSQIERWQISGEAIAALLAKMLELNRSESMNGDANRWEVGTFKWQTYSSHLVLIADGKLHLTLAGHSIAITDVLAIDGNLLTLDRLILRQAVSNPVTGGGDIESAEQKSNRLKKRKAQLQSQQVKNFLQVIATEESISTTRVKQILNYKKPA